MLAGRIAAAAKAGEILVSSALKQYTETDPRFEFEPRGEHHFKGLSGEHDVYAVPLVAEPPRTRGDHSPARGLRRARRRGEQAGVLAGALGALAALLRQRLQQRLRELRAKIRAQRARVRRLVLQVRPQDAHALDVPRTAAGRTGTRNITQPSA